VAVVVVVVVVVAAAVAIFSTKLRSSWLRPLDF
jgi:hypothetical protein